MFANHGVIHWAAIVYACYHNDIAFDWNFPLSTHVHCLLQDNNTIIQSYHNNVISMPTDYHEYYCNNTIHCSTQRSLSYYNLWDSQLGFYVLYNHVTMTHVYMHSRGCLSSRFFCQLQQFRAFWMCCLDQVLDYCKHKINRTHALGFISR